MLDKRIQRLNDRIAAIMRDDRYRYIRHIAPWLIAQFQEHASHWFILEQFDSSCANICQERFYGWEYIMDEAEPDRAIFEYEISSFF